MNIDDMTIRQLIERASTINRNAMAVFLDRRKPIEGYYDLNKNAVDVERKIISRFMEKDTLIKKLTEALNITKATKS